MSTTRAQWDLVRLLGPSLGDDKARDLVRDAAALLGVPVDACAVEREHALALLERLAERAGLVGTVARFVKVRVILQGS